MQKNIFCNVFATQEFLIRNNIIFSISFNSKDGFEGKYWLFVENKDNVLMYFLYVHDDFLLLLDENTLKTTLNVQEISFELLGNFDLPELFENLLDNSKLIFHHWLGSYGARDGFLNYTNDYHQRIRANKDTLSYKLIRSVTETTYAHLKALFHFVFTEPQIRNGIEYTFDGVKFQYTKENFDIRAGTLRTLKRQFDLLSAAGMLEYKIANKNEFLVKFQRGTLDVYEEFEPSYMKHLFIDKRNKETISLIKQKKPENGTYYKEKLTPSFRGVERDYENEQTFKMELGSLGEDLVITFEKNVLMEAGLFELAEKVRKVKDGEGYDVLSFFENGNPKFIEVKTTQGGENMPFDITSNELSFSDIHYGDYFIYRLFNYDITKNTANFYVIENLRDERVLVPTSFRAFFKNSETQSAEAETPHQG